MRKANHMRKPKMKLAFVDYVKDIGLTYLIILTITLGIGIML